MLESFEAIMAPLGADTFLRDYLGQRPLHLEGSADKWREVMSWPILNRLLGQASIWSAASMPLVLDKEPVPVTAYAAPAVGRDGGQVMRPDPAKVQGFLERGATLVANDIEQLTPELRAFAAAMEQSLGGKVQGNLYLSSKRKQGFRVHFDTHDVFAVHAMGEKTWFVFEGRADAPIAHAMFEGLPAAHHEAAKGALWREVRLKPGDLLYLPRGQYHYALADDGPCAHIAFGVTYPIGLDVMPYLFERIVAEPLARRNLPQGDEAALADRLAGLADRIGALLREPQARQAMTAFIANYRYPRAEYDLPGLIEAAEERWRLKAAGVRLVEQGGRAALARPGTREAVEIPSAVKAQVAWILGRPGFTRAELAAAFPADPPAKLDKLLADLSRMALVQPD
ncbi:MAG TPA: cupin domain-containing protein [Geminicoccaceae bacterium]|nr:cupin domain-containing protein [Geminicoccus sp.]HMU53260.1 cupin domain-containing protein [Geminicoccaceae bacterium]